MATKQQKRVAGLSLAGALILGGGTLAAAQGSDQTTTTGPTATTAPAPNGANDRQTQPPQGAPDTGSHQGGRRGHDGGRGGHGHGGKGQELEAVAKALGMTVTDVRNALQNDTTTIAQLAQQQGKDPQTVIDALVAQAKERITNRVNGTAPTRPVDDAVAKALGVSAEELQTARKAGTSITDLATQKNVSIDTVKQAVLDAVKAEWAQKVSDGLYTQAEADEHVQRFTDRIDDFLAGKGGPGDRKGGRQAPPADQAPPMN